MLQSDLAMLEKLLATDLIFTNHLGQQLGKADDLAAHKSGKVKIDEIISSEQRILISGNVAVVSVRMSISGIYDGAAASGHFRFTRVWENRDENCQVIAAHSSLIV